MTSIVCFLIMFVTASFVGCSDGNAGRLGDGEGAEAVDASTSASTSTSDGQGGSGAGGGTPTQTTIAIATIADCPEAHVIAPGPAESGAVALGRFDAPRLPFAVHSFTFVADTTLSTCAPLATELVYWASASAEPDQSPTGVYSVPVVTSAGLHMVQLDPPMELTTERPHAYVGLRVRYGDGGKTCIVACIPHRRPELSWWSDRSTAPYGWRRLSDSPTPALGPDVDWLFAVTGR